MRPSLGVFEAGKRHAPDIDRPETLAAGIRVPKALGDFLVLDAVRASGGQALAARETDLVTWMRRTMELTGIALCPESAACVAALPKALEDGHIQPGEQVVIFNTGAAQKYVEVMAASADIPRLDRDRIDWSVL